MPTKTPGYSSRLTIRVANDKNGRPRATRWSKGAMRWFPMKLDDARRFLANGEADRAPPPASVTRS